MKKIQVVGNITKDCVIRQAGSQTVINFNIAENEKFIKDGQKVEKVTYFNCSLWREKTEIAKYLLKGVRVWIDGKPEATMYENKEGQKVPILKITVRDIELLGGGQKPDTIASNTNHTENQEALTPPSDEGSDLPF